ncbi:Dipeptidyl peptidase 3 [Nymphon striatum]|nr:Dipeptidyl peptidase 3 [Nymphon striatum]
MLRSRRSVRRMKTDRERAWQIAIFNLQFIAMFDSSTIFSVCQRMSTFTFPKNQPVVELVCDKAFADLTSKEKLYAHYLSRASWYGGLIVLLQTSPESPAIFQLLTKLFGSQPMDQLKTVAIDSCSFSEDEFNALMIYTSGILTNMGNYKGFGDTKFIPDLKKEKIELLIKESKCYKNDPKSIQKLWDTCSDAMFALGNKKNQLGLGDKGITTYFSENCTSEDGDLINDFLKIKNIEAYNNRAFKTVDNAGKTSYEIRLASVIPTESNIQKNLVGSHQYKNVEFKVTRGDYSGLLSLVSENLLTAKEYASNETEQKMIDCYIDSFTNGSLDAHKDGSRHWIKNKGPIIETYIGFIETYRDPLGMRGEFEGFVSIVNKSMSKKFTKLVESAEEFLPLMPWPAEYEKDKFLRPDFTSLDVLTYAGSGIPAGINIPNYDEIRQDEGFKNVSLGNVIPASYKDSTKPFLSESDQIILAKHQIGAFEIQVGLHELLGHGSGKLFSKKDDGTFNFDFDKVKNLETGEAISKWYENGETYDSKFTRLGSAYEECRAECVGLHLCVFPKVAEIFGYSGSDIDDVVYVNWLEMVWRGLLGMEMYQPDVGVWSQAHCQARFVIMNVLLEAGKDFTKLEEITDSSGEPNLVIRMDQKKIETVGRKAIADFLKKLQLYKSCGDEESGRALFNKYSAVSNEGRYPFLSFRNIVLKNKRPRKMFVQANTVVEGDNVVLKTYGSSHQGLIQSWVDRFAENDVNSILQELWKKDQQHFST